MGLAYSDFVFASCVYNYVYWQRSIDFYVDNIIGSDHDKYRGNQQKNKKIKNKKCWFTPSMTPVQSLLHNDTLFL